MTKPQTVQIVRQGEATPYWFKVNPLYFRYFRIFPIPLPPQKRMRNTKIATVYQLIKFTASLLHPLDKSWPNRNNPSKFAVLQYRFRKSSNEFRQSSVFRRPQHGFFDLLHHSGLTLNRYGVASPCRTICTVCGFVALS